MKKFDEIIGQEHIVSHLVNAIRTGNVSHAYLLQGEAGSGKSSIAEVFAMALQCEEGMGEPCLNCHSCKQALSKNHPDIRVLTHAKDRYSVDEIREQFVNDIEVKPYSGEYKVYIIPDAQDMNPSCQNAILKTLEEPPAYAIILLLCTNSDMMLETIRSRCVTLNIHPLKDEQIKEYLMSEKQVPDYRADVITAFARGNLGRAGLLTDSESFEELRSEANFLLKSIKKMEVFEIAKQAKNIVSEEMDLQELLNYLILWFRDVLLYKATHSSKKLLFKDELRLIKEWADDSSFEGLSEVLRMIDETAGKLRANVNKEATLELLMLKIKES